MIPIIYYAHALQLYNTEREKHELHLIQAEFPKACIFNPNRSFIQHAKEPMKRCIDIVKDPSLSILVFSDYKGEITQGVYFEIQIAKKHHKELFFLTDEKIFPFTSVSKIRRITRRKKSLWKVTNYASEEC